MELLTYSFAISSFEPQQLPLIPQRIATNKAATTAATQQTTITITLIGLTDLPGEAAGDGNGGGCSWVDIAFNVQTPLLPRKRVYWERGQDARAPSKAVGTPASTLLLL